MVPNEFAKDHQAQTYRPFRRRLKPLFRNASKLTRRLSKTKGNPKTAIPSKHLENGVGSDFGAPFGHRYVFGLFSNNVGAFSFPMKPTL